MAFDDGFQGFGSEERQGGAVDAGEESIGEGLVLRAD